MNVKVLGVPFLMRTPVQAISRCALTEKRDVPNKFDGVPINQEQEATRGSWPYY